jgi:hypothetical protein
MKKSQTKGYLLEIVLERLLKVNGYNVVCEPNGDDIVRIGNGLNVVGRGALHQFDSLGTLKSTPPFMYPLRIFLEAKYRKNRTGIDVIRNGVGILQDINTNYSTVNMTEHQLTLPRYNYNYVVFSTSGFSIEAQKYSIAHKIYLVDLRSQFIHIKTGIKAIVDLWFNTYSRSDTITKEQFQRLSGFLKTILSYPNQNIYSNYELTVDNETLGLINEMIDEVSQKPIYLANTNSSQLVPLIPDNNDQFIESLKVSPHQRVSITRNNQENTWTVIGRENTENSFILRFELPEIFLNYILSDNNNFDKMAYNVKEEFLSKFTFIAYLGNDENPTICTLTFDKDATKRLVAEINNVRNNNEMR